MCIRDRYVEAWLSGNGCVPLYHLMEDAATAEISRSQLWQWLKHESNLDDGRKITEDLIIQMFKDELESIKNEVGTEKFNNGKFDPAMDLFREMILKKEFDEFLTLPAYQHI